MKQNEYASLLNRLSLTIYTSLSYISHMLSFHLSYHSYYNAHLDNI